MEPRTGGGRPRWLAMAPGRALALACALQAGCPQAQQHPGLPFAVFPHAAEYEFRGGAVANYELGLGALQKIGGRWRFRHSERLSGHLSRHTWQVVDGYTAREAFAWYRGLLERDGARLYACAGRSCGRSAQWAVRVFQQRVLYGHDDRQEYGVWRRTDGAATLTYILYATDRANRRHYVHLDILEHAAPGSEPGVE